MMEKVDLIKSHFLITLVSHHELNYNRDVHRETLMLSNRASGSHSSRNVNQVVTHCLIGIRGPYSIALINQNCIRIA